MTTTEIQTTTDQDAPRTVLGRTGREYLNAAADSFIIAFGFIFALHGMVATTVAGHLIAAAGVTACLAAYVAIKGVDTIQESFTKVPGAGRIQKYTETHQPPRIPGPTTIIRRLRGRR